MIIHYPLFFLRVLMLFASLTLAVYNALFVQAPALYAVAAAVFLFTLWFFDKRDGRFEAMYNSHWATPDEIEDMFLKNAKGREVLLGYAYNKPIALKENLAGKKELGHVLVVGPSRAGKGLHASANLLNWTGSVVVVDIKGEFYHNTAGYRHDVLGQDVQVLNPSTGALTNKFDPFAERDTDEQLLATATAILNPDGDGSNKAFGLRATFALFAIMKTAKLKGYPVLPYVRECIALGTQKCMLMLHETTNDPAVHRNISFFLGSSPLDYDWDGVQSDKFLNNSWMNLIAKMTYMLSDGVVDMTSESDFKAVDLIKKPMSLYLVFRESDLKYTVHALSSVLLSLVESIIKYYDLHPDEPTVPILFIFDEAGRITVPELPELTSTVAGRGMIAMIYVQALAQLETTYDRTGADTIKANTHTKIYFTPKDADTAKYISENSGKYMVEDQRHNVGEKDSDSTGLSSRELIAVDQVLKIKGGRVLIHSNEFPYIAGYRMEPFTLKQFETAKKHKPPALKRGPRKERPPVKVTEQVPEESEAVEGEQAASTSATSPATILNQTKQVAVGGNAITATAVLERPSAAPTAKEPDGDGDADATDSFSLPFVPVRPPVQGENAMPVSPVVYSGDDDVSEDDKAAFISRFVGTGEKQRGSNEPTNLPFSSVQDSDED